MGVVEVYVRRKKNGLFPARLNVSKVNGDNTVVYFDIPASV